METKGLRTWVEVDTKAVEHNFNYFKGKIGSDCKFCAVVKSNAYGHNFIEFSKLMEKIGTDFLAVDSVVEGVRLRKEGIKSPILILGYTVPERMEEAIENDLQITISTFEGLFSLKDLPAKVHIKVDTGMHRQGFLLSQAQELLTEISKKENISIEGVYTHFSSAKNPTLPKETRSQINEFLKWQDYFKRAGFLPIFHAGATSGTLLFPEAHFDMVRVGIGLYGLWPSLEVKAYMEGKKEYIKPALTWKTIISEIKELPKGSGIGYDLTEKVSKDSKIAICPFGYWHGYSYLLSGIGPVFVGKNKTKILGRVSMDMIVIDVTDFKTKVGDEVVVLGGDVDIYEVANLTGVSWYETITRINPLIKRIYK